MKILFIKPLLFAALLTGVAAPCFAQKASDSKKSGDHYFTTGDYYSAAYYYQQYLEGAKKQKTAVGYMPHSVTLRGKHKASANEAASSDDMIRYRLAESYRKYNDYAHAEGAYKTVIQSKANGYPDAPYWYGVSLRANGKYAEAKEQLEQYLKTPGASYSTQANIELQNIAFAQEQQKSNAASLTTVSRMAGTVNTSESNYGGRWSADNLVFTSTRPDSALIKQKKNGYVNALYTSDASGAVQKINIPQPAETEQGVASMSPDGSKLYLTRWNSDRGVNVASIYVSEKKGSSWSEPVKLNNGVNVEGSSSKQPFVTADGKYLLFASNRSGGKGGYDIWQAPISGNDVGAPVNLTNINTPEDDEAPFYHEPTQTLVFASKGRVGMGGFDLYKVSGTPGGEWSSSVQNMGYPVNSNKDDNYFSTSSKAELLKSATISSDRNSDYCMAIYTVDKQYKKYVSGNVTDCATNQLIPNVSIGGNGTSGSTSGETGSFVMEVKDFNALTLTATKQGYENGTIAVVKPSNAEIDTVFTTVCLKAMPVMVDTTTAVPAAEDKVYFEFAKYTVTSETAAVLDTVAAIMNRESKLKLVATGYTDKVGSDTYNQKLSDERAKAVKTYLVSKGVAASRIETVGKGACCPLKPETTADGKDDPAARQMNRRVEFDLKLSMK